MIEFGILRNYLVMVLRNPQATPRELIKAGFAEINDPRKYYEAGSASGAIPGPYHHLIDEAISWGAIAWSFEGQRWIPGHNATLWLPDGYALSTTAEAAADGWRGCLVLEGAIIWRCRHQHRLVRTANACAGMRLRQGGWVLEEAS